MATQRREYTGEIEDWGFALVPGVLSGTQKAELVRELEALAARDAAASHTRAATSSKAASGPYALRNILTEWPGAARLARSREVRALVEPVLGCECFAVRGILFDKVPGANWKVVWHQDLSIAVRERIETPGFTAWSVKDGVAHVQPPAEVLERMLTVRLHLDDCFAENGSVRVLPGSHRQGRLNTERIAVLRESIPESVCESPAGGALVMRPLILHASSQSVSPAHRRVIHIEYAPAGELPNGMDWRTRL